MGARTKARKRALEILFQAQIRGSEISEILQQEAERAANEPERMASWLYAREIVDGYVDHAEEIDAQISGSAEGWSLERMPAIDLSLLRIAVWEIRHNDEVPVAVAINEAVKLAGEYSTEDSGRFINGVLGNISERQTVSGETDLGVE